MLFSALLIIIFHLWIPVWQGNIIELFIQKTAYIGVDVFFFLSAYSLAKRDIVSFPEFWRNRILQVYVKFFLFSIVGMLVFKWQLRRFLQVISSVELMRAGGGAFLWFLPAIMWFYLLFCVFSSCEKKHAKVTLFLTVLLWLASALAVTYSGWSQLGIIINRIPIFLLGYYVAKYRLLEKLSVRIQLILGVVLCVIGCAVTYQYGYNHRIQVPFADAFYLTAIPLVLGLILLVGRIPSGRPVKLLGAATLEMYAVQMIAGYSFTGWMIKQTENRLLINVCSIVFVVVCAVLLHSGFDFVIKSRKNNCKEKMLDT
ncbi:MAG: acyltransferase [bacterium]|nr:acyltransferase [bacterium]